MTATQAKAIASKMKFTAASATDMAAQQIEALYQTFIKCDCTMVEVRCEKREGGVRECG